MHAREIFAPLVNMTKGIIYQEEFAATPMIMVYSLTLRAGVRNALA
jgi:hypothetical protein